MTRQPVHQQIGDQECRARTFRARLRPVGHALEQRVERLELQPIARIQPGGVPSVEHLGGAEAAARRAIGRGVADQPAVLVQQPVVHGPRVDSDRINGAAQAGLAQAIQDSAPQREDVPLVGHAGLVPRALGRASTCPARLTRTCPVRLTRTCPVRLTRTCPVRFARPGPGRLTRARFARPGPGRLTRARFARPGPASTRTARLTRSRFARASPAHATRPGEGDGPVREAGALLDGEALAVEHAPQDAPRGGPEVDCDDGGHHAPHEACWPPTRCSQMRSK